MSTDGRSSRVAVWAAGVAWMAFWFWAFSLAYSDSFFAYDRHSRLPILAAALLGTGGIFVSAVTQWRARGSVVARCLRHVGAVVLLLCPLLAVSTLLSEAPPPWRPSADDAMGAGIDLLLLAAAGMGTVVVLACGLALRTVWRRMGRVTEPRKS